MKNRFNKVAFPDFIYNFGGTSMKYRIRTFNDFPFFELRDHTHTENVDKDIYLKRHFCSLKGSQSEYPR